MCLRCWLVILLAAIALLSACAGHAPDANKNTAQSQKKNAEASLVKPKLEGIHDVTNCEGIMGWAWDKNRPDEPVKVDIYDGDALLASVTASDFREDLVKAGIGNGKHGFTFPVPPRLKDGKAHSIRMKFAGESTELGGTPKQITCHFQ